jgi:cobalt-zinc-cadmium efflux system membrane fusion protein
MILRAWFPMLLVVAACGTQGSDAGETKAPAVVAATVVSAVEERFIERVDAVGQVTARVGHSASLAAPAATRVAKVLVTVGQPVKAGDALVEFERAPFDAAQTAAEMSLAAAEKGAARAQRLADAGVGTRRESEVATAELATARSAAIVARRAAELATLRAPMGGVVTRMSAVVGASVDPAQVMVELVDPTAVDVELTVAPTDAAHVRAGQRVELFGDAAAAGEPLVRGTVGAVSAVIDSATRGVQVRVALEGAPTAARVGQSVFGRIAVAVHAKAVQVPVEALVPTGEGFKLFVVDAGGIAHGTEVKVGGRTDRFAWITDGLKAGDRVVTKGAFGVDDSTKVVTGKP